MPSIFLINYYNFHTMRKLYSKFLNSLKLNHKIPKYIKLKIKIWVIKYIYIYIYIWLVELGQVGWQNYQLELDLSETQNIVSMQPNLLTHKNQSNVLMGVTHTPIIFLIKLYSWWLRQIGSSYKTLTNISYKTLNKVYSNIKLLRATIHLYYI